MTRAIRQKNLINAKSLKSAISAGFYFPNGMKDTFAPKFSYRHFKDLEPPGKIIGREILDNIF